MRIKSAIFLLLASTAAAQETPDQFFGLNKVHTFHLTISADQFEKIQPPGGRTMARPGVKGTDRYPVGKASLVVDGVNRGEITLRYKGNSSYGSGGALKRPLKLEFGSGKKFFGMSTVNLSNNAMDPSQMREALAYDVFRREGIPTPRTAFAKVYLTVPGVYDDQYAGLYTVVEQVDETFLVSRLGAKTGPVLKPEGLRGMPYEGPDWSSYLIPYGAKSADKVDPESAKRMIAFIKFANDATDAEFAAGIKDWLDTEEFLHMLAVEVVIVNLDSPLSMNHNYYVTLDPKTKKVIWIPWDMNEAFGKFGGVGGGPIHDLSVNKPSARGAWPLADRMLAAPEYLKRYDEIVQDLVNRNFTAKRLGAEIDGIAAAIRAAVKDDQSVSFAQFERQISDNPEPDTTPQQFGGFGGGPRSPTPPLRQFVALRVESVLAQLAGKRQGLTSSGRGRGFGRPPGFPN